MKLAPMHTLFDSPNSEPHPTLAPALSHEAPQLLTPWTPWHRVFLSNLAEKFRRARPFISSSEAAEFWPDVFVRRGLPWAAFRQSALYHIFAVVALWGFSVTWLARPAIIVHSPYEHTQLTYYRVSEYLPPLESDDAPAKIEQKGQPAYAKQRIVSRPRDPDNSTQTIITPNKLLIRHDVPLPNIVAMTATPAPPLAAVPDKVSQLPRLPMDTVEPEPRAPASNRRLSVPTPTAVQPVPEVEAKLNTPLDVIRPVAVEPAPKLDPMLAKLPNVPAPSAVEPAPAPDKLKRPLGQMNMAQFGPQAAPPPLRVPAQRATGVHGVQGATAAKAGASTGAGKSSAAPPIPAGRAIAGGSAQSQPIGQLIALGLNPAPPNGPISVPNGSRHGVFAAGPDGKPGAPGIPEVHAGGKATGGTSKGGAAGPEGIHVGNVPGAPSTTAGAVVAGGNAGAPPAAKTTAKTPTTLLAMSRPSVSDLARATRPGAVAAPEPKVEDAVFGPKKFYQMTLNMPNLTSASGTWIMRFAELHQNGAKGELTAPVATQKVDPAYPSDLMRDRVEGTVVLYAVIHMDGTVGEVRVLHSVDSRLDDSARIALLKWHFQPATKNGAAVDLETVVRIPFIARKIPMF